LFILRLLPTYRIIRAGLHNELYIFGGGLIALGLFMMLSGFLQISGRYDNGFVTIINDFQDMPGTMKQLALVQFFSWFALFSMWIYATSAVTSFHYGSTDTSSKLYNDGADWVGILMGTYNGFAALAAIAIPFMARLTSRKATHTINLCLGAAGLISVILIRDPVWLLVSMLGVGFAWASILSVPYTILSGCLPSHKLGVYMGIFNFFIVIPQILAVSVLGSMLNFLFDGQPIYILVTGGVAFLLAAIATQIVDDQGAH